MVHAVLCYALAIAYGHEIPQYWLETTQIQNKYIYARQCTLNDDLYGGYFL